MSVVLKQTQYISASSHSNDRTEFVIPQNFIGKNFRLIDFGLESYSQAGRYYAYSTGSLCVIDRLTLYSGSEIINSCRLTPHLAAKQQLAQMGSTNYSIGSVIYQNSLGYNIGSATDSRYSQDVSPQLSDVNNSNLTWVDLGKYLPFLLGLDVDGYSKLGQALRKGKRRQAREIISKSNVIRCDLLNLRLEIEYQTQPQNVFVNGVSTDTFVIRRPTLCIDKLIGLPNLSDNFSVMYDNFDAELAPITSSTDLQQIRLTGCDGRFLKEVTMSNVPLLNGGGHFYPETFKQFGSLGQLNERVNMIVNSEKLLPQDCDSTARKQMYLDYNNPKFMCPLFSNLYDHSGRALYTADSIRNMGEFSYLSLDVGQRIVNLYLQYQRDLYSQTVAGNTNGADFTTTDNTYTSVYELPIAVGQTVMLLNANPGTITVTLDNAGVNGNEDLILRDDTNNQPMNVLLQYVTSRVLNYKDGRMVVVV
jgi:hypothetical protein